MRFAPTRHLAFLLTALGLSYGSGSAQAWPAADRPALARSPLVTVDVLGTDERVRVPPRLSPAAEGVGFLWQRGSDRACSSFCVGDSLIATNAHCLVSDGKRQTRELNLYRFVLAPEQGAVDDRHVSSLLFASRNQPLLSFYTGSTRGEAKTLDKMVDDWAFAKLAKPICRGRVLGIAAPSRQELQAAADRGDLAMIAYHGDLDLDWRWLSPKCGIEPGGRPDLLLHTCDTFQGSSGAPLLMLGRTGAKAIGINVGTYEIVRYRVTRQARGNRITERRRVIDRKIANVAVPPDQFSAGLERFAAETLLRNEQEFETVQSLLRTRQLYKGRVDGIMGPRTREAIMSFEQAEGLSPLGLPTRELMERLSPMQPPVAPSPSPGAAPSVNGPAS